MLFPKTSLMAKTVTLSTDGLQGIAETLLFLRTTDSDGSSVSLQLPRGGFFYVDFEIPYIVAAVNFLGM